MSQWESTLVSPDYTVKQTIEVISKDSHQVALVVNSERKLIGVVTDGDFRRAILKGIDLDAPVTKIMAKSNTTAFYRKERGILLKIMRNKKIRHLPLLDEQGVVMGLLTLFEIFEEKENCNQVVIMAGGLGTRLGDLTKYAPKSLLKVGKRPILETLISNFIEQGFNNFILSVNFLGSQIMEYFGEGSAWGVNIQYLQEPQKLGTAGSLSLLSDLTRTDPIIVMNGDILTKVNFSQLLDFHHDHKAEATMCVREYDFQVPYGVVALNQEKISSIVEKPVHTQFVNAGIYVLSRSTLKLVPKDRFFDMTDLFHFLLKNNKNVIAFPLREYWIDIGRSEDLEKANHEYVEIFENQ